MKAIITILILSIAFGCKAQSYIFEGRQDSVPCTMIVSSLFATDGVLSVGDTAKGYTRYFYAKLYAIRGYHVCPEHSEEFYLDENKLRMPLLHVWTSFPYNYHVPNRLAANSLRANLFNILDY